MGANNKMIIIIAAIVVIVVIIIIIAVAVAVSGGSKSASASTSGPVVTAKALPTAPPKSIFNGHFTYLSKNNYENYLTAIGVSAQMVSMSSMISPQFTFVNNGQDFSMTLNLVVMPVKVSNFTLNKISSVDMGSGAATYNITLLNAYTLNIQSTTNTASVTQAAFNTTNMVMTFIVPTVTANMSFKRA